MNDLPSPTVERLCAEAADFAENESRQDVLELYEKRDGKSIGTYLERKFTAHLECRYSFLNADIRSRKETWRSESTFRI